MKQGEATAQKKISRMKEIHIPKHDASDINTQKETRDTDVFGECVLFLIR